jgi:glycosyltransferase involved in cell wall biosynthesis
VKASVLVGATRAHAYSLSDYLARTGQLGCFYIGLPKVLLAPHLRPFARTFPWLHLPAAALLRSRLRQLGRPLQEAAVESFDRWVAGRMEPCDVFMAMSGQGLRARRAAQAAGALTVCDRGSSHILYQDELLAEEYARHAVPYRRISRRAVETELEEYVESDLIVVQSSFAYRTFVEKGVPDHKLAMVPLGVEPRLFHPEPKRDGVFRVLYVGEMSLRKGVPYLLEALASSPSPPLELVLIGPVLDEIKPWFARYEGRFRYLGAIRKNELYRYYSQASVFVMPTIEDGFGLVVCEALACGVPVITTAHCCGPDIITDGREGFIVPIRDPKALRERVLMLYAQPPVREAQARAALGRARSLNGWDGYGRTVVELYRKRLNERRQCGASR